MHGTQHLSKSEYILPPASAETESSLEELAENKANIILICLSTNSFKAQS